MTVLATNAEKLVEAEAAYHALMIGGSARVVVDSSGERVEYTSANSAKLAQYIEKLKNLIAGSSTHGGPLGVMF